MKRRAFLNQEPLKFIAGEDIHPMDLLEIGDDGKAYKADLNSEKAKSFFFRPG